MFTLASVFANAHNIRYSEYRSAGVSNEWCRKNFVNGRTMRTVVDTRGQLRGLCARLGLDMASGHGDTTLIRKALLSGLFRHVAVMQPSGAYRVAATGQQGYIHPASALVRANPPCILYSELVKTTKLYFRTCTEVDESWFDGAAPRGFRARASAGAEAATRP